MEILGGNILRGYPLRRLSFVFKGNAIDAECRREISCGAFGGACGDQRYQEKNTQKNAADALQG